MIITSSDVGKRQEFCSPRSEAVVFGHVSGAQFAATDDYVLNEGDSLQFEVFLLLSNRS